ncbi:MAG: HEAT repeat domain-containing protein [Planctomycetaceae bacterium]|nr:HEAT repeat domain-containing protein [Planctomycetaceae bacterium]
MPESDPASPETSDSGEDRAPTGDAFPETLPPVEPPSARFIVQLFLIPALIVGGVIGVYFLFGRLATGELDWRQQVDNVRSQNPHVRWRGALSLADMLDADANLGDRGQKLAANPDVASALTELFTETQAVSPRDEQTASQLEFLAKALGRLDSPEIVFPVILRAVDTGDDPLLRKHGLTALVMISGRALEQGHPLGAPEIVQPIVAISGSEDPLDRHQAAFILGLLSSPEAQARLEVLLQDTDLMTRANAAIGLARHKSLAGLPVFESVFAAAVAEPLVPEKVTDEATGLAYFERSLLLKNCLHAVEVVSPELTDEQRSRLARILEQVADATKDAQLSIDSRELSLRLAKEE